ncbi:MAG: DUF3362 domain-containing protein, partial [Thermoguttaceae bacterium]|nr:DUF3362 domain-containing protein [Thermoguttaceae bacterium]
PKLAFCISAGNMDSMLNHYTANRKVRNDDAYTPGGEIGRRPDRATLAYCQRAREAFPGVPILAGGVEASLRRIAHYDYWSDKVKRSIALDSKCDLLMYGMGERSILEIIRRLAAGEDVKSIRDVRGTVYRLGRLEDLPEESETLEYLPSFEEVESPREPSEELQLIVSAARKAVANLDPDALPAPRTAPDKKMGQALWRLSDNLRRLTEMTKEGLPAERLEPVRDATRREVGILAKEALPASIRNSKLFFTKMTRIAFANLNPYSAKTLVQEHGEEAIVVNPPAFPLSEAEMDAVYELPFTRKAHPSYTKPIPALEVVRTSVQIHRGCYGGCTFCAITAHQGKFIQSRSEGSIVREIQRLVRDAGGEVVINDLSAPTANMYKTGGKNTDVCKNCARTSCLCPEVCPNLNVDHGDMLKLMRAARSVDGVKSVLIASGIRTDLANFSPEFIDELAARHVGGRLKTAPEHVHEDVLALMNKPPIEDYERFCEQFAAASEKAGKKQYLTPYLISGFPGCGVREAVCVAEFLKTNGIEPEQAQDFIPAPFQWATCMFYTQLNPANDEPVYVARGAKDRAMQRALIHYYDPAYYHDVKNALRAAHRMDLMGEEADSLIPKFIPKHLMIRRTGEVERLKRKTERERQEKAARREEFERQAMKEAKRGGRVGRERDGERGGYRDGARRYGRGGGGPVKMNGRSDRFADRRDERPETGFQRNEDGFNREDRGGFGGAKRPFNRDFNRDGARGGFGG